MIGALREKPHRRFNPLTGDWVLVSPHRAQRPWQGQAERTNVAPSVQYDPACYLCPGNERAGGKRNPHYTSTYVFTNDFAALLPDEKPAQYKEKDGGLLVAEGEAGTCRVVCFSPRHDLTLSRMRLEEITGVVNLWAAQYAELAAQPKIHHVQIFENRGEMMGCSNLHPHCQIWATETIPNEPRKEFHSQHEYLHGHHSCLLCDYLDIEKTKGELLVCENDHFVALVPFWAAWPFETMVISKSHARDLLALSPENQDALADILKRLTTRYDNLFKISFPYSMGFHQAPTDGKAHPECHLHTHFYPPLLRSATIRKFMVGYEMLAEPQRDITPEAAADRIRASAEIHWTDSL
jgi:UDPglucose--hexose-1-phosphate uridylyltransferase